MIEKLSIKILKVIKVLRYSPTERNLLLIAGKQTILFLERFTLEYT